jgi:penicillin amidase
VFADTEGNIGYQVPGRIPIRAANHAGTLPVDGSTDDFEWLDYIPFDLLPRMLNPERGYIATANQAVVPLEYYDQLREELGDEFGQDANYIISQEWSYGYRGQRIDEMMESNAPHSIPTFQAIHGDNKNLSAVEIMPYLADLELQDTNLAELRDWLLEWDFQMHMDSPQAAFYAEFWSSLMANLYGDQLGEITEAHGNDQMMRATFLLMDDPENSWWDNSATEEVVETRNDILIHAFSEGYQNTIATLGQDRNNWKWGSLHTTTFVSNPLGASGIDLIENMVNRGPFPTSGGGEIVNATGWNAARGFEVRSGPSERVIYDLSDFGNSRSIHTTGQSGHPFSPHYGDQIDQWRNIEYHPMLWSREQVEAATVNRLVLNPGN